MQDTVHYNIAAINLYNGRRRIILVRGELPREELLREVALLNSGGVWHYALTTEGV